MKATNVLTEEEAERRKDKFLGKPYMMSCLYRVAVLLKDATELFEMKKDLGASRAEELIVMTEEVSTNLLQKIRKVDWNCGNTIRGVEFFDFGLINANESRYAVCQFVRYVEREPSSDFLQDIGVGLACCQNRDCRTDLLEWRRYLSC